jgi:formaldehyde-activating enzyme involved in methanogenesis
MLANLSSSDAVARAVLIAERVQWELIPVDQRDDDWISVLAFLSTRINEINAKEKK